MSSSLVEAAHWELQQQAPLTAALRARESSALLTQLGCLQGYGLTETCAASFVALPRQDNSGTVGPPTAGVPQSFHNFSLTATSPVEQVRRQTGLLQPGAESCVMVSM